MFDLFAELSGLTSEVREHRLVMVRVAEALERISPPLQAETQQPNRDSRQASAPDVESQHERDEQVHHLAESPEEYIARIDHESDLATSLGVAPWSPDFQRTIMEVREELMKPRKYQDEEGNWKERAPLTEEEADDAVREGFRLAKAEANVRGAQDNT
jgi:hypothetical protein